jgi:hypothetical protein
MPDIEKFLLSKRISAHKPKVKVVQKKRLAEAEPTVFTYDALDPDSNQIRLLRILPPKLNSRERRRENSQEVCCEIFHANLDEHPSYKALSYTRGDEYDPRYPIYINGRQFEVRENLFHALHRFRSDGVALVIWIDAICINQINYQERNYQVAKMTMIYEQATEVVAWLGPSYDDSDLAFRFMQELYEHRTSAEWIAERFSKPDIRQMLWCLAGLNYRQYWRVSNRCHPAQFYPS